MSADEVTARVRCRHVDTLVNYGSLLKTVHNELATAEKVVSTAAV